MNRIKYYRIAKGEKYPMVYTLTAAKVIADRWKDLPGFFKAIQKEAKGLNFQPLLFCIELLIRQGCAYMNTFLHDIPLDPEIPLTKRGFYKPITGEQIAERVTVNQLFGVLDLIAETYEVGITPSIEATLTAEAQKNARQKETSGEMAWYDFHCRSFGISQKEYHLLTPGEITDLATCRAIQNGVMEEEITTAYLPRYV